MPHLPAPRRLRDLLRVAAASAVASIACVLSGSAAVAADSAPPSANAQAAAASGPALYARYCKLCHAADATGYAADHAPSLVSHTFLESASDDFISRGIRFGRPGTAMAAYSKALGGPLEDAQVAQIVAFLRSKGPAPAPLPEVQLSGNVERGKQLFARECQSCHAATPASSKAPSLQNPEFLAAASPAYLRHAIVNGRPPTRMPAFGQRLKASQIDDLVAWLESAPKAPFAHAEAPSVPADLPLIPHPKGKTPQFTLRENRYVPAEQVRKALAAKQRLIIIDARSPADWLQFHIPGAVSIPYYETSRLTRVPNDGTWVVAYCACPHHASGAIVDALQRMGYPHTAVLDEGILYWQQQGFALEGTAIPKQNAPR
jgi:cytochrome c oxidase cbb3-type subunit 3